LLSLDNVKAVVQEKEAIITATTEGELEELQRRVSAQLGVLGSDNSLVSFDQAVLKACIQQAVASVRDRVASLRSRLQLLLANVGSVKGQSSMGLMLNALLPLKNELDKVRGVAQEMIRALNEVLLDDEDLDMMQLSQRSKSLFSSGEMDVDIEVTPREQHVDHSGTEMLLESYLSQLEGLESEANDLISSMRNTEEIFDLQLDLLRNRILRFELRLNFASFVLTIGTFITGAFGMNLLSHLENNRRAFRWVNAFLLTMMGSLFMFFVRSCQKQGLLS